MTSDIPASFTMVSPANLAAIREDSMPGGLSSNDICNMFKEFLIEFEKMRRNHETTPNMALDAIEEMADAVLLIPPPKLLDPKVLHHPLIRFLHQMLVNILDGWHASNLRLNIQESDVFLKIVSIFSRAVDQAPAATAKEDKRRIRELLGTTKFLTLITERVDDNVANKDGMNDDPNICVLGLLIVKLLQGSKFYYKAEENERFMDDLVVNCLDSYDYIEAVRQLQHGEPLTDVDRFLLYTCWEYIPLKSMATKDSTNNAPIPNDLAQNVYEDLLKRLEYAPDESSPTTPPAIEYTLERSTQILNIPNLRSFDKHANYTVDRLTKIIEQSKNPEEGLDTIALKAFDNLSKNTDIRAIMKKRKLAPLFKKYTPINMGEKRQLAFSILAQVMDEQEVKDNPEQLTAVFIEQLKELDPKGYNPKVDGTLTSLKALMQHEQTKNEFIKQGGLQSLITFIRDGVPSKQSAKQLEDALEILWSCTFNNPEVSKTMQQDKKLMTRVNELLVDAKLKKNSTLEKAAEGLIWKVEKEEQFKEQQEVEAEQKKKKAQQSGKTAEEIEDEEEEEKYDLMVSYSWADMELAHRIFHHLTEKLGYKVWLDQEQMHGSTIEAMANAVENAQFILMCMSDTYKRSANCQSEAEYAFNKKKHIVPCKMKKDYVADGWLGFILGTRMYIDFGSFEFEKAMELLGNEIALQKKKRKDAKLAARAEKKIEAKKNVVDSDKTEKAIRQNSTNVNINGKDVSNWSETKVRDFLLKQNLSPMVPLCDGINGEELMNLHTMCKTSSAAMYRSLKFELLHTHHRILPIAAYLHFISRIGLACSDGVRTSTSIANKPLDDYLQDSE